MGKDLLTPKEIEIVKHTANGKSRKEIAGALGISKGTVDTHFKSIFIKLNTRSMVETVIWAMKNGYS